MPSTVLALKIALGCRVEDMFSRAQKDIGMTTSIDHLILAVEDYQATAQYAAIGPRTQLAWRAPRLRHSQYSIQTR